MESVKRRVVALIEKRTGRVPPELVDLIDAYATTVSLMQNLTGRILREPDPADVLAWQRATKILILLHGALFNSSKEGFDLLKILREATQADREEVRGDA